MRNVIDTVGLTDRLKHRPSELSGGQQQRVAVARALANKPELIFADEPTGNLDSRTGAEILGFMRYAVDRFAQTVVMVTHDPVAAAYADRVLFLADGRIVDSMTVTDRRTGARPHEGVRSLTCGAPPGRACGATSVGSSERRWPSCSASRSSPRRWPSAAR